VIAHELNNIAGVIAMATELLKEASTQERHETLLRLIDDAVARISGVASRALEMPA
jgi:signal transduction histidine kinase